MNLLLDTHALLWWLGDSPMAPDARQQISDPATLVVVSAASAWEIAIKRATGKLRLDGNVAALVVGAAFTPLPVSFAHAERAGALPPYHRDPFDRLLVAQAQLEGLALVTRDVRMDAYDVTVVAC
ncbi:MAG: type II toxin-antitoxin system VapC family toxin [Acidimicrobiia bacterium]|nr:type II toxin-antitoxin system VapC family toxin [Acidimicrobiia bacterium]